MEKHIPLEDDLNSALAYSYVLGWYAGSDGKTTDEGKKQAAEDIKAVHPGIVQACNAHEDLLEACKEAHDSLLCLHVCDQDKDFADKTRSMLSAAIAKAESE